LQFAAKQWLIYRLTNSAFALGYISFVGMLPVVPIALVGGTIIDRASKRKVVIVTETGLMLQAFILAFLAWTGTIQIWHLILLEFMFGLFGAIDQPARQAFLIEMVGKEDLTNAIALNASVFNMARALGPAIGGLLMVQLGEAGCFFVNGLTFLALIGSLLLMRMEDQPAEQSSGSLGAKTMEGFTYLLRQPVLLGLISLMTVVGLFGTTSTTLMPIFARDVLSVGEEQYGFLLAAVGIGAVLGALSVANIGTGHRGRWLWVSNLGLSIALVLFAASRQFTMSWLFLAVSGAGFIALQALVSSLVQTIAEDRLRGRVISVYTLLATGSQQLGAFVAGGGAQLTSAPFIVAVGAVICGIYGLGLRALMPSIRRLT
jgi:MFS family permease